MSGTRKQLGAWYTPEKLVDTVIDAVITREFLDRLLVDPIAEAGRRPIRVLDPACGDGRFLVAATRRLHALGLATECTGCDLDPPAVDAARSALPDAVIVHGDALTHPWTSQAFDVVIGNPPYLSQMASATTRGGSSGRGGGPYADAAVDFLSLASDLVDPHGGRVALVLPQSILASRDAAPIRAAIDGRARMVWSWWSGAREFDAQVHVCVVAFEFGEPEPSPPRSSWSHVITSRRRVPGVPDDHDLVTAGRLGDRATANANFRDEYYGMVPAVGDHSSGPPLISSGLIDPGRSWWAARSVTFAKHRYERPRVDLGCLDARMTQWAQRRLVPKVLVANQTRIVEAVCDPDGRWLPAVPVLGVYPTGAHWDDVTGARSRAEVRSPSELADAAWEIAAVLTSPFASAWAWHRGAGTGLSADTIRLSPVVLAALPWPAGDLSVAVDALQVGDVRACGRAVDEAYGIDARDEAELLDWWQLLLERIEARGATGP